MNSKHTAGPWKVESSSISNSIKIVEDKFRGNDLASVWSHNPMSSGAKFMPMADEAEANARLISAAPELLEALERILYAHDNSGNGAAMGEANLCSFYATMARLAIEKAKGTQ